MDEAALAQLVQALEGGAAAFSAVQRPLLSASFADSAEGASATPLVGDDAWTAAASERASEAREGEHQPSWRVCVRYVVSDDMSTSTRARETKLGQASSV